MWSEDHEGSVAHFFLGISYNCGQIMVGLYLYEGLMGLDIPESSLSKKTVDQSSVLGEQLGFPWLSNSTGLLFCLLQRSYRFYSRDQTFQENIQSIKNFDVISKVIECHVYFIDLQGIEPLPKSDIEPTQNQGALKWN